MSVTNSLDGCHFAHVVIPKIQYVLINRRGTILTCMESTRDDYKPRLSSRAEAWDSMWVSCDDARGKKKCK